MGARSPLAVVALAVVAIACQPTVFDVNIGECINFPPGEEVTEVEQVACEEPHDAEVFALPQRPEGPDDPFPGDTAVREFADERCQAAFEDYVGRAYADSSLFIRPFIPTMASWDEAGDRQVVCLLVGGESGEQLSGVKRGSRE